MKRARSGRLSAFLAVAAPLFSAVSAAQTPTFSVQVLPNLAGGTGTSVSAINNAGEAVGSAGGGSSICPRGCPVVWIDGTPTALGSVPGTAGGLVYSINNAGQAAGDALTSGNSQAVIWNNGTPTLLTSPGSQYTQTFATSINASGEIVGQAEGPNNTNQQAVAWNSSTPTVLSLLSGYTSGLAWGINSNGLIVGTICCDIGEPQAVVWHGTTPTLLPRLKPTHAANGAVANGKALAVNDLGVIVGVGASAGGQETATAWANGSVTALGMLSGYRSSAAAVNNRGIIVGDSDTVDYSEPHAVIWSRIGAETQDLNSLIGATAAAEIVLTGATGINDSCAVVANGYNVSTRAATAYLLTLIDASKCVNGL
jgi:probable HAF family extracellular repeat protein